MRTEEGLLDYSKYFNRSDFFIKLGRVAGKIGLEAVYTFLIVYFLFLDKGVPMKVKAVFMGALGYFIFPLDFMADFLPVVGFADDVALITYVIAQAKQYLTPEIKEKARLSLHRLIS